MLEALDLGRQLGKAEYKQRILPLQLRLHQLQRACWKAQLATLVVVDGWDAAGKGATIRKLTQRLEPRGFDLHVIREPRTFETHLPWMWRYWAAIPTWGEIALFDRSWCAQVVFERVEGERGEARRRRAYVDIRSFERALTDDRYLIAKFFLHIDKSEQKARFDRLASDPSTAWRVEQKDWDHHEKYDQYLVAVEEMLEQTETEWGPWTLVEATDRRWARVKVFETLVQRMESGLVRFGFEIPEPIPSETPNSRQDEN